MIIVRFQPPFQAFARPEFGIIEGETVYRAEGHYATGFQKKEAVGEVSQLGLSTSPDSVIRQAVTRQPVEIDQLALLSPCQPTKIVALGRNYAAHAAEHGSEVPKQPLIFLKPSSAVTGPGEAIVYPSQSQQVEHEAELAVIIGRRARRVTEGDAWSYILGYTCANDVTARDLQRSDGQWSRAKGFDTFAPLGPWIVTDLDPSQLAVVCRVNGEQRQRGSTADMVFKIPQLVEFITAAMTLEPGDVILTGTPEGVGPLRPGDQVEVEIEGIGVLRNYVMREE